VAGSGSCPAASIDLGSVAGARPLPGRRRMVQAGNPSINPSTGPPLHAGHSRTPSTGRSQRQLSATSLSGSSRSLVVGAASSERTLTIPIRLPGGGTAGHRRKTAFIPLGSSSTTQDFALFALTTPGTTANMRRLSRGREPMYISISGSENTGKG
jgi:hypothetical protein